MYVILYTIKVLLIIISIIIILLIIISIKSVLVKGNVCHTESSGEYIELLKTVTNPNRGTYSERALIINLLELGIPPQTIFHDLYVRRPIGNYSQIDVVVPTKAGIIVFEVKDYSGWIFGNGLQSHWCQVLSYGREKYRFYNPVKQNETHISSIRHMLKYCISTDTPIYSVIVFYGNCILKDISKIPNNTFVIRPYELPSLLNIIMSCNVNTNYVNKMEIVRLLKESVANGENSQITTNHSWRVRDIARNQH